VPHLIHLNGPAAVGKSTVARLYADRHPGVLNLDVDQVVNLIGGWRENLHDSLAAGRKLAISMAETYLRLGRDVIMPQLVTVLAEAERFQAAAVRADAEYHEIVLLAGKDHILNRSAGRSHPIDDLFPHDESQKLLLKIHDDLVAYADRRPDSLVVHTDELDPTQTHDAVTRSLARATGSVSGTTGSPSRR
jgi:predicted kinase